MREFMSVSKALSDPNRVRLVMALRGGELCVCRLTELFGLAPSTMSKHLSILYQAQLVNARKDGRWVYYSLPGQEASASVLMALEWVNQSLAQNAQIKADAQRLKQLLKIDASQLCLKQA
jgi:DNA-binding transcriptional ArsR family regulator